MIEAFEDGLVIETGERVPSREYVRWMGEVPGLRDAVVRLGTFDAADGAEEPALVASRGRVPARGPAPAAPPEQGPRRDGRHLPPLTTDAAEPDPWPS